MQLSSDQLKPNPKSLDDVANMIMRQQSQEWSRQIQNNFFDFIRNKMTNVVQNSFEESRELSFKDSTSPCNSSLSLDSQLFDSSGSSSLGTSLRFDFKPLEKPLIKVPSPHEALRNLQEQRYAQSIMRNQQLSNQAMRPEQPSIPNIFVGNQDKENLGLDLSMQRKENAFPKSPIRLKYACKLCPKSYHQASALKMHIRTHTLPCRCTHCGKAFSRKWLLKGHERTHTGERPYQCGACGRSFADRSNLRAHMQTHQNDKRYKCPSCPRSFSRMGLLNKHLSQTGCSGLERH